MRVSGARRCWPALAVLGVALLLPSVPPASAQVPASTLTPAQAVELEKRRAEGKAAIQADQWGKAREAYLKAWTIQQDWRIAANLGRVEIKLERHVDAAQHLDYAVREAPTNLATAAPDEWNALRELQQKARTRVGAVVIAVEPAGAEVLVNGLSVGKAPLRGPVFVEPGAVTIEVKADGYALGNASTSVGRGKEQAVALKLVPLAGAGPKKVDVAPPVVEQGRSRAPGVVLATVSGAGVVTGAILLGLSATKTSTVSTLKNDARQAGGCVPSMPSDACTELRSTGQSRAVLGNAGQWTLVAGGAVGFVGIVYLVATGSRAPSQPKQAGWSVLPVGGGDGGGLVVRGSF